MKHVAIFSGVTLALVASGCGGNWSNRDLEFINALPTRDALQASIPGLATSSQGLTGLAQRHDALMLGDPSQGYLDSKKAVSDFNGLLDTLLGIVENVRQLPPTSRTATTRTWGPFKDGNNPGFEAKVEITQVDAQNYTWAVRSHKNGAEYFDVITGQFRASASLKKGQGTISVPVKTYRGVLKLSGQLAQADAIELGYITDMDPSRVEVTFTLAPGNTTGLSSVHYTARTTAAGSGAIQFVLAGPSAQISELSMSSRWSSSGGIGHAEVTRGTYTGATADECWSSEFKLVFYKQSWPGGVTLGNASDCVTVSDL